MPGAEQIVITAAYRALASRYHPDRWKGDKDEATRMMSKINVAYGVLGDTDKRKAYDASRGSTRSAFNEHTDEAEEAFAESIHDYDEKWEIACSVYPSLETLKSRLSRTSSALAFSFVIKMLDTKQFEQRDAVADQMERIFLERYFGTNPKILAYVRKLIRAGARDAVKHLNKLVDVLGDEADADKIIQKVNGVLAGEMEKNAAAEQDRRQREQEKANKAAFDQLRASIEKYPDDWGLSFRFAELCGYSVMVERHLLKKNLYKLFGSVDPKTKRNIGVPKILVEVDSREALSRWIADNIARLT